MCRRQSMSTRSTREGSIRYVSWIQSELTLPLLSSNQKATPVLAYATAVCCVAYGNSAVVHLARSKHIIVSSTSAS
jgi:hypothetical protein